MKKRKNKTINFRKILVKPISRNKKVKVNSIKIIINKIKKLKIMKCITLRM